VSRVTVEIHHDLSSSDAAEITELLRQISTADGFAPLSEQKCLQATHAQHGRGVGARSMAQVADSGRLVGYGHLSKGNSSWGIEVAVHPDHRDPTAHIAEELLHSLLDEVGRQGGGRVFFWATRAGTVHDNIAMAQGLLLDRELIQMRVPLPILLPSTVEDADQQGTGPIATRPFQPGRDESAWLAVNNRAFSSHPEQGGWDLETLLEREREPWFDPLGFLLHDEEGRLIGSCWTKIHHGADPPLGEIYVISVDPDFHGRGLGRSLTIAGLSWLADAGLTTGMLYVEADNIAAVRLYRSLGFTDDHVDRAYVGEVASAS
jgi:mycothiol synthase